MEVNSVKNDLYVQDKPFNLNGLVGLYETVDEMGNPLVVDVYSSDENLYVAVSGNWPVQANISTDVEYDLKYSGPVSEESSGEIWTRYGFYIYLREDNGYIDFQKNCENSAVDKLKIYIPGAPIYTFIKK